MTVMPAICPTRCVICEVLPSRDNSITTAIPPLFSPNPFSKRHISAADAGPRSILRGERPTKSINTGLNICSSASASASDSIPRRYIYTSSDSLVSACMALEGLIAALAMAFFLGCGGVSGTVFTLVNRCSEMIWPGILTGSGGASLAGGGFALLPGQSAPLNAPAGWSGRFWARTGCAFNSSGAGSCDTGDCGHGLMCDSAGGVPPVSLAEFTIGGEKDFYDVSLVDGYNVPLSISAAGGTGDCRTAGCVSDLRSNCPALLSVGDSDGRVIACKSACDAFGAPEYCCTGDHGTPQTCSPNQYSQVFKAACPSAYSYAYDDATSTFTCSQADYTITFCPSAATN